MAARNLKVTLWTLVQHSAFGYKGDPTFEAAVETFGISTVAARDKVMAAGGLLFADYTEASDAEYAVNYPTNREVFPGDPFLLAIEAGGTFSGTSIGELRIYVPTSKERRLYSDRFSAAVEATS